MISLQTKKFTETAGHCDIIDITPTIHAAIEKEHLHHGLMTAFVSGSTAALTTIEHESGLIQDLKEFVERLIPSDRRYHHDDRWGDDNGFSTSGPRSSVRPSRYRSKMAEPLWELGSKWISIIAHARVRSSSNS